MSRLDRFLDKVSPEPNTGCWLWTGTVVLGIRNTRPYGHFKWDSYVAVQAHRAAFRLFRGEIPDGLVLDHLCRTPECVNPAHLEPVTNAENRRRGAKMRLTAEAARAIFADTRRAPVIADEHGITWPTVYAIKARRLWRDVTLDLGSPGRVPRAA